jgi:LPS export ABC transporter protein LptC
MPESRATSPGSSRLSQRFLLIFLGVALAGIGLLVMELPEELQPVRKVPLDLQDAPDLVMTGAEIHQYRESGSLHYLLNAQEIRYFERDELTRLTAPNLILYATDEEPWQVTAAFGYLRLASTGSGEEEVVFLRKDVNLQQRGKDGDYVSLSAPSLYLYPGREYAETEHDVIIDSRIGRTLAVGLQGDLRGGLLRLFSQEKKPVHTILLPDQFK